MSRKDILKSLEENHFKGPALPEFDFCVKHPTNLVNRFIASAKNSASQIIDKKSAIDLASKYHRVVNFSKEIDIEGESIAHIRSPYQLNDIDLLYVDGIFGVAENGAIWVSTDDLPFRVLPFIAEHLVICIKKENLVANMHDAYAKIESETYGFGVFIAGPSKTADIEQSLVIGAQGPKSLRIVIME